MERYTLDGIDVIRAPLGQARADLNSFRPDVLCVHAPFRGFQIDLANGCAAPKISWIHGAEALFPALHYHHFIYAGDLARVPRWLKEDFTATLQLLALRKFLPLCNVVVYVSEWMRRAAESSLRFRHPRSFVIPNPVDLGRFRFRQRESARHGLSVRGLGHKYGVDVAVKAFVGATECDLTVVGQGVLERYLRRLAARTKSSVRFDTGGHDHAEIPALMDEFDFFVAPSRTEGQGVAMCEAMATGMPIVASMAGGIPEFVRSGIEGILYWPNRPRELREAIEELARDTSRFAAMSGAARARAESLFSPANTIEREIGLLREAARG